MTEQARRAHCTPRDQWRLEKARKIEVLLSRRQPFAGARLLEVGAGAGIMAAEFARLVGPRGHVVAVDAHDQREVAEGYEFVKVEDATLPLSDEHFDIVISNHVMEHIGGHSDQRQHLREICRVLRARGWAYIAVPNRWRVVEPHFHLPFLSWLPQRLADRYVRRAGKGDWYDVVPPSARTMAGLLDESGLLWEDCTIEAARVLAEVEPSAGIATKVVGRAPTWLLRAGSALMPTMIYIASRPASTSAVTTRSAARPSP